jgi:hypothetical protein
MQSTLPVDSYVLMGLILAPWFVDRLLKRLGGHPAKAKRCPRCGYWRR